MKPGLEQRLEFEGDQLTVTHVARMTEFGSARVQTAQGRFPELRCRVSLVTGRADWLKEVD